MCVVVTMNLLNPLSKYGLVCSYELVCEVVNYYHDLQLLVLLSFVYCFHILMSGFFLSLGIYGSVVSVLAFRRPFVFDTYLFELFCFRYPVSPYSFSCSTIPFSISFSY